MNEIIFKISQSLIYSTTYHERLNTVLTMLQYSQTYTLQIFTKIHGVFYAPLDPEGQHLDRSYTGCHTASQRKNCYGLGHTCSHTE